MCEGDIDFFPAYDFTVFEEIRIVGSGFEIIQSVLYGKLPHLALMNVFGMSLPAEFPASIIASLVAASKMCLKLDSGTEYVVKAELPGLKKETLAIDVGTNELSLAADSDVEREEKGKTYLHRERAFSTFRRNIGFPESVDTEKVSAKMAEGILEVRLPKLVPDLKRKPED